MSSAPADVPAATRVENAGLDVISESDRKGRPSDLFMPWFAANISVLGLSWGAWVLGFGLSFWQAVVAGSVGVIVSFLLCGVVAVLGKRGSAPTLALSDDGRCRGGGVMLLYGARLMACPASGGVLFPRGKSTQKRARNRRFLDFLSGRYVGSR